MEDRLSQVSNEIDRIIGEVINNLVYKGPDGLGILWEIIRMHNAEKRIEETEEELDTLLDEKNIVELVKGKFKSIREDEQKLNYFLEQESHGFVGLKERIGHQNRHLVELKRLLEERERLIAERKAEARKKERQKILKIRNPKPGDEVYVGEHLMLEAELLQKDYASEHDLTFQWYIQQGRQPRINIHSWILGESRLPIPDNLRIGKEASIIVELDDFKNRRIIDHDEVKVIVGKKQISGPTALGKDSAARETPAAAQGPIDFGEAEPIIMEEIRVAKSISEKIRGKFPKAAELAGNIFKALVKIKLRQLAAEEASKLSASITRSISGLKEWASKRKDRKLRKEAERLAELERQRTGAAAEPSPALEEAQIFPSEQPVPYIKIFPMVDPNTGIEKQDFREGGVIELKAEIKNVENRRNFCPYSWIIVNAETRQRKEIGAAQYAKPSNNLIELNTTLSDLDSGEYEIYFKMKNITADNYSGDLESQKIRIRIR